MILFNTIHIETYNYIIHHFLQLEIFEDLETIDKMDDMNIGDRIENLLPKYLFREQYQNCVKVYRQLFYWTADDFYHQMEVFHELVLYQFIDYMADLRNNIDNFDELYFDEKCHSLIRGSAEADYKEDIDNIPLQEVIEFYYDVFYYPDALFTDRDFKVILILYNRRVSGDSSFEHYLGINIDFYFDILSLDLLSTPMSKTMFIVDELLPQGVNVLSGAAKIGKSWLKNSPQHKVPPAPVVRRLDYKMVNRKAVQHYFEEQLAPYPDLLTVVQIAEITGYSRNIVSQWCRTGRLKTFTHQPKIYIPKPWVLDFLLSEDYNSLVRKSQKHCAAIREILWQERQRDSPAGKA